MRRRDFTASLAALGALAGRPARARAASSAYDLTTPTGTISGTLDLPAGAKPPVVIVLAGSGPVDRDGNEGAQLKTDAYAQLGAALVARGIACVRFDKRGIGLSKAAGPPLASLRIDAYVADAQAWVAKVRADGRFSRVVVAGHSEGSLIGILAAPKAAPHAFVSLEGPGRPLGEVIRRQLGDRLLSMPALLASATHVLDELEAGRTVADPPPELIGLFSPQIQPYLISELSIDPAVAIAKLSCTVALVQGTYDLQVSVDDAKLLAAAAPHATLTIVPKMSHVLKIATSDVLAEQVTTVYSDPSLPIAPAVVDAVAAAAG